jgi:cytochrome c oxidase subunit IV
MTDPGTDVAEPTSSDETGSELVPSEGASVATQAAITPAVVEDHAHPGPRQYVLIAVVLCVLTAMEVGLYYLEGDVNNNLLIAMLWVLAFVKFFLVCSWYMHMRMDAPFFRRTFVVGIALATGVYGAVLLTFASTVLST